MNALRTRSPLALTVLTLALFAGCEPKGPAEKAGQSVDRAADKARDAVDPAGPAEKAGRAVDDAVNK